MLEWTRSGPTWTTSGPGWTTSGSKNMFFGLFRAKMNTVGIQNPKLIVTNDYQQFLAHFEWFLALFQISDVKPELSSVDLKVSKNGIFWAKNQFQKIPW